MTLFPKITAPPVMCCVEYSLEACYGDVGLAVFKRRCWSIYEREGIKITVNTHTRLYISRKQERKWAKDTMRWMVCAGDFRAM
jgi:hypothetical protein